MIERAREKEFHSYFSSKLTFFKIYVLHPLEALAIRLCGLRRRARNELVCPVVTQNKIEGAPEGLRGMRILHLSDLHIDILDGLADIWVDALRDLDYDLCVITGDYRNRTVGDYGRTMIAMKALRSGLKGDVYLVPGNHDFLSMVEPLEEMGYRFLINEATKIEWCGAKLGLVGIDDPVIFKTHDIEGAVGMVKDADYKILLSHSSRVYKEAESSGIDLVLCGHTHGGQICLPGGRAIIGNDKIPCAFIKGAWRFGRMHGYTSRGLGAGGIPYRLNCRSEIVVHCL